MLFKKKLYAFWSIYGFGMERIINTVNKEINKERIDQGIEI